MTTPWIAEHWPSLVIIGMLFEAHRALKIPWGESIGPFIGVAALWAIMKFYVGE